MEMRETKLARTWMTKHQWIYKDHILFIVYDLADEKKKKSVNAYPKSFKVRLILIKQCTVEIKIPDKSLRLDYWRLVFGVGLVTSTYFYISPGVINDKQNEVNSHDSHAAELPMVKSSNRNGHNQILATVILWSMLTELSEQSCFQSCSITYKRLSTTKKSYIIDHLNYILIDLYLSFVCVTQKGGKYMTIRGSARGVMVIVVRKWTQRHEFKSWTRMIAFHIALIPCGKVWIQLFSLLLWVNSRAD